MKKMKKLYAILLVVFVFFTAMTTTAFAADVSQDGLEVSLVTDKEAYNQGEQIAVTLAVKNTNEFAVKNVTLENLIPDGYVLADGASATKELESLEPSETAELAVTFVAKGETPTDPTNPTDPTEPDDPSCPGNNDWWKIALPIFGVTGLVGIIIALVQFKKILALILAIILAGSVFTGSIFHSEANDGQKSINITETVKVDSEDKEITANVYYDPHKTDTEDQEDIGEIYFTEPAAENVVMEEETGIEYVNNELLLVAKDGVSHDTMQKIISEIGGTIVGYIELMGDYQVRLDKSYTKEQLEEKIAMLRNNPNIHDVTLDYAMRISEGYTPKDPWGDKKGWNIDLPEGDNWGVEAIRAPQAWDHRDEMSPIKIGVIDSGFDTSHDDLTFSWIRPTNSPKAHGTHVAGIVAADWDKDGISGVMPTSNSRKDRLVNLMGVNLHGEDFYQLFTFEMKSNFAELILRNAKTINMSLGFNWYLEQNWNQNGNRWEDYYTSTTENGVTIGSITDRARNMAREYSKPQGDFLKRALNKGYEFLLVCAAGNDDGIEAEFSSPMNAISDATVRAHIMVVGAIQNNGIDGKWNPFEKNVHKGYSVAGYSNLGARVDIVAPGSDIYSANYDDKQPDSHDLYTRFDGTSMAAPHVTGVAAMVWAINPRLTGAQVKEIVKNTADRPITYRGRSYDILNAENAVNKAIESKGWDIPWQPEPPQNGAAIGRVVVRSDENTPIGNANVAAYKSDGTYAGSAVTDGDGQFELMLPEGQYTLMAYAEGYIPGVLNNINVSNGQVNYLEWVKLVRDDGTTLQAVAKGKITNAINGSSIPDVTMTFKSVFTQQETVIKTDSNGNYSAILPVGYYDVSLSKEGFIPASFNVGVSSDMASKSQNTTMSPVLDGDEYRIVLTWGQNPSDLDSHITGKTSSGSNFHVYYSNKNAYDGDKRIANLDVDDTTSYGPETITLNPTTTGVYKYYVYHFSGSESIAKSGAQVKVYRGNTLIKTYNAPTDQGDSRYWNVFTLENGVMTDVNTITSSPS